MRLKPTKAMILAAGQGKRLRPLTESTPKPLIRVQGKPLIEHHLGNLAKAGVHDVIINLAHLGEQIRTHVGDGQHYNLKVHYSDEAPPGLETGGGLVKALPLLGPEPFWVVNGDVLSNFDFNSPPRLDKTLAHLILVPNPPHNPKGDFSLVDGLVELPDGETPYTFAGISFYHPDFFKGLQVKRFSVTPLLKAAMKKGLVSGELYQGLWHDIGTLSRLKKATDPKH
jgi:MurNAc alpha-1-phosphate uridylyltransferase